MAKNKKEITAIVKTHNCEKSLYETLEAIRECGEIIVVDSHSTDDTIEIANEYRAKIIYADKTELQTGLNSAIDEAEYDWILYLEDDEIVPKNLLDELENYSKNPKKNKNAVKLNKKIFLFNRQIKAARVKSELKFFKKGACVFENNISQSLKLSEGKAFKIKKYSVLKYVKTDISTRLVDLIQKNKIVLKNSNSKGASVFFKPFLCFLKWYILKRAFLDGTCGFIFSKEKALESFIFEVMKIENFKKTE